MKLTIVKIGGNIIDNEVKLSSFLRTFAALDGARILVHGGGKVATAIGEKLGIESKYVNGRRITDRPTLDLATMVYGGLINKSIVAQLQSMGCNAIGLSGADAGIIRADRRPVKDVDYGYVGDVSSNGVSSGTISALISAGLVLVLAPLTHDGGGNMLNTNADTIAQEVAKAMASVMTVQLIYCFEKKGVLCDPDDDTSVINSINKEDFEALKAGNIVSGGMLPKLENAFEAISCGVRTVSIGQAEDLASLITGQAGTSIV